MSGQEICFQYRYKCILCGDSGTGKTCLLMRYLRNEMEQAHMPTLGVEFGTKVVTLPQDTAHPGEAQKAQLQIWDTAGTEHFRSMVRQYFRSANASFLVYDITSRSSFDSLNSWIEELERECPDDDVVVMVVGNKCDDEGHRAVSREEGEVFASKRRYLFIETSASTGTNVERMFEEVAAKVREYVEAGKIPPSAVCPSSAMRRGVRVADGPAENAPGGDASNPKVPSSSCPC